MYFKTAESVIKYTKTKILSQPNLSSKISKSIRSPFYKHHSVLMTEDELWGVHEVIMDLSKVKDNKPVHVGVAILQHSKIMFLQFVDFLRKYLVAGSYQTVYCDTGQG